MSFKASGFDNLQRTLKQAEDALNELNGTIADLSFNPADPISVENAISEMKFAIDAKVSPYRNNKIIEKIAHQMKKKYEEQILSRTSNAILEGENAMSDRKSIDQSTLRQIENTINDLRRAEYNTFDRHMKKLVRLLDSSEFAGINNQLTNGIDLEAWIKAGEETGGSMIGSAQLEWPSDSKAELGTVVLLARRFAENPDTVIDFSHTFFYNGNNIDSNLQNMIAQVFLPFARDYIDHVKGLTNTSEATLLPTHSEPASRKVFVVHGHDDGARESVARFLEKLEFEAIILHEQANQGKTIIEKIEAHGDVGFAVVLLTPDDIGCRKDEVPISRARQNVILELGYFLGRLGRARVCALRQGDVEVPSDFGGVVYETYDSGGSWKSALARELQVAGFEIDWNKIMRR